MENKINIAELLKDCPKDMELDCLIYEDVYFDYVDELNIIHCYIQYETYKTSLTFNQYGIYNIGIKAKCVIFPKGKTTWEGFHRPFEDGDIITDDSGNIAIYKGEMRFNNKLTDYYCGYRNADGKFLVKKDIEGNFGHIEEKHLATEEEKQKLFNVIKANGYHWNSETKTLEKLPKFKVGNKIKYINGKNKDGVKEGIILSITNDTYDVAVTNDMGIFVPISEQDNWELAPNKFDITTLKPFDKVLVRNNINEKWNIHFFSYIDYAKMFKTIMGTYIQCIPYEGNEHLLNTNKDCDEYYKNW